MDSIGYVCQVGSFPGAACHRIWALLGVLALASRLLLASLHDCNVIFHFLTHQEIVGVIIQELHILICLFQLIDSIVLIEHVIESCLLLGSIVVARINMVYLLILIKSFTMLLHEEPQFLIDLLLR